MSSMRWWRQPKARETDLDRELRLHLEMEEEEQQESGLAHDQARYAAQRTLGNTTFIKEAVREMWGWVSLERLLQDLRYAGRVFLKTPGFTAVAVCCLALGIGANTAIFSVMNAVMLKMLPVKDPQQLDALRYRAAKGTRRVRGMSSGHGSTSLPYNSFLLMREHSKLSSVFAFVPLGFSNQSLSVNVGGQSSTAGGEMVSGDYFRVLGVSPVIGRSLTLDDERPGSSQVAVISYGYWIRQFGGSASAVGRSIRLNGAAFDVVGVMPPQFRGVDPQLAPDIWVPLREYASLNPWGVQPDGGRSAFADKRWWWLMMMARRQAGVSEEQARAELDVLFKQAISEGLTPAPKPEELPHIEFIPASKGFNFLREQFRKPLYILFTGVGLLLLIACANVAVLLLARSTARRKEMGVRLATGASRLRLVRQLLTESVLLAAAGGVLGMALARWGGEALFLLMSQRAESVGLDVSPDATVLAFSAGVCMLAGVLFGLTPALRATRVDLSSTLKESSSAVSPRLGLGKAIIAAQVAISLVLLIGAGLFVQTMRNLKNQDLGFNQRNLLLFQLDPRRAGYSGKKIDDVYQQILERLETIPGVRGVTSSHMALLSGWINNGAISTDGPKVPAGQSINVDNNPVGPGFFETMGIRVLLGRGIDWRDIRAHRRTAVVNESLARYFYPNMNPVGRHFNFGEPRNPAYDYEIAGVVADAKYDRLRDVPPRTVYIPFNAEANSIGGHVRRSENRRGAAGGAARGPARDSRCRSQSFAV